MLGRCDGVFDSELIVYPALSLLAPFPCCMDLCMVRALMRELCVRRDRPKSQIFSVQSAFTKMFAGFRSR